MTVEFRLLGDVEVRIDGRDIDIGHSRQRCVLVALLVEANQTVPADHLLDRVWADRPPQRARNALSGYVSRLRQVLAVTDEAAISRRNSGYRLTVDPLAVDLGRFRHLVAQAHAVPDPEDAVAWFDQALALWRGEAFATLDTHWLAGVRAILATERLTAELDRNDLALGLGRHLALLSELSSRAAEQPLHERLAGQLMLALYRSGRQAAALHHYEQVRLALADDLGTDPSPPLRHLHQQILTADLELTVPAVATIWAVPHPRTLPVPRQLPPPPRSFTGRSREIAALDAMIDTAGERPTAVVISEISGTPGVGKTALAVHWAHRIAGMFTDGQLYVNLRGFDPGGSRTSPAEAVRGFLDAFDVPQHRIPIGLDAQVALYRSLLAGRRVLIVLDNARDAAQIRPLLPGAPGCLVLATSRSQLTGLIAGEGAHPLTLDLLTAAEAHDLLAHRIGLPRIAAEPDAVTEIITRCARLPLALTIVAARAATHPNFPLAALASELRDANTVLNAFSDSDPATDVRAVFSWSYHSLSDPAARLFRLLGLHPGPDIGAWAAASLGGMPITDVRSVLAELTHAHLLTEHTPGRYACHDLLRTYAAELAETTDGADERRQSLHRVLDYYVATGRCAAVLLDPHREPFILPPVQAGVEPGEIADQWQAMAWFAVEHSVLLDAIRQAADSHFDSHAWQLAWTLCDYFNRRGYWRDQAASYTVALAAARRLADRPGQAYAHRGIARARGRLGQYDDAHAHFGQALDLYGALGEHTGEANTHLDVAWAFGRQDRHREALSHSRQALDLYYATGSRYGQAMALNNVGWCQVQLGDSELALASCRRALALHRSIRNRQGEASASDSLGYVHHHLGDHQRAIAHYQRAIELFREGGDLSKEAATLANLGDSHLAAGDLDAARDALQHALNIFAEGAYPDADQIRVKLACLSADGYPARPAR